VPSKSGSIFDFKRWGLFFFLLKMFTMIKKETKYKMTRHSNYEGNRLDINKREKKRVEILILRKRYHHL